MDGGHRQLILKANPEKIKTLLEFLEIGATYEAASQAAGIGPRTFFRYMKAGADEEQAAISESREPDEEDPFWRFWQSVKVARANYQITLLKRIEKAEDPRLALEMLKRRFRADFGDNVSINPKDLDDETLLSIFRRLVEGDQET